MAMQMWCDLPGTRAPRSHQPIGWVCEASKLCMAIRCQPVGKFRCACEALEAGTASVVASVLGLLTGAASGGGFAGIGGQFVRRGLLQFHVNIETELRLTRTDTGQAVLA